MNQRVADNLETIITALEADTDEPQEAADAPLTTPTGWPTRPASDTNSPGPKRSVRCANSTAPGTPVNFELVARNADVSRSWLYTQPDIRAQIERLREATRHSPAPAIPAAQRTSDASLLTRLQAANENNRLLTQENQRLRRQLAHALGDQRTGRQRPSSHDEPSNRIALQ